MISEDEEKTVVHTLFLNKKFSFTYDVRDNVTSPGEFLSLGYNIDVLKSDTKDAIEMQVHTRNFKRKRDKASSFGYFFWLIRIYKLKDIKFLPVTTPEKRQ